MKALKNLFEIILFLLVIIGVLSIPIVGVTWYWYTFEWDVNLYSYATIYPELRPLACELAKKKDHLTIWDKRRFYAEITKVQKEYKERDKIENNKKFQELCNEWDAGRDK